MGTMQSPEEVKRRRKFAEALMAQSVDASPVQHPMQAVARALQGLYGGYLQGQASREEKENEQRAMADLMAVYGGQSQPQPQPQPQQPAAPQTTAPIQPQPSGQPRTVADAIIARESGGNPNAKNPMSSATGAGQFIDSTWLETLAKNRPDLVAGKSREQLLQMRADPALSREMTAAYARENAQRLQSSGYEATPGNQYLAHFAGPAGAQRILGANPATPVRDVMSPEALKANPFLANMTVGDLQAWANKGMSGVGQQAPAAVAQAGPPQVPQSSPQMPAAAGGMPPNMAQLMRAASNPWLGRTGQVLAGEIVKKQFTPRDQWVDERGPDGSFYQRNLATGERKVVEKSGVLTPEAFEQQVRLAKEKKPETNIDLRRESKFNEEGAKILTKQFGEILESSRNAVGVNAEFDALRELSQRIGPTGKTSEITLALGPYAEALGIKIDKLSDLQAYNAIVRKMAPRMRPPGSGATSDFELRQFLEALPSLGKTPEGNELIANTNQALLQHQIAAGDIAGQALSGKLSAEEAMKKLRELPDPMALWKKSRGSLPTDKASGGISIRPEVLERLKKYQEGGQ